MDSELDFAEHIAQNFKKATRIAGIIRRSFTALQKDSSVKLFPAFVRPHLEYGQAAWLLHLQKYQWLIEEVKIQATKLVYGVCK